MLKTASPLPKHSSPPPAHSPPAWAEIPGISAPLFCSSPRRGIYFYFHLTRCFRCFKDSSNCLLTNIFQLELYPNSSSLSEGRQIRDTVEKLPEITSQQEHGIAFPVFTLSHCMVLQRQSGISDKPQALPSLQPHLLLLHLSSQTWLTSGLSHKKGTERFLMDNENIRFDDHWDKSQK